MLANHRAPTSSLGCAAQKDFLHTQSPRRRRSASPCRASATQGLARSLVEQVRIGNACLETLTELIASGQAMSDDAPSVPRKHWQYSGLVCADAELC